MKVAEDVVAFIREHPQESLLIVVARASHPGMCIERELVDGADLTHLFGFQAQVRATELEIQAPGAGAGIWRLSWPAKD